MGDFINTFQKGLNSDYNIILQPDGTYRYLKNCQLIAQDGNNYTIKDCMGNVRTFLINIPYDEVYTDFEIPPMPIMFISFPDVLVVGSTNSTSSNGGAGAIGIIRYLPYGQGVQPKSVAGEMNAGYIPLYYHDDLNFSKLYRCEGFGYEENALIKRIYWTDNFNQPRVFNISDPIFTTYIASGSLVVGRQYMVLEGAITHNAVDYGPGITAGNIFTAVNANYTNLTGATPTPKVVEYYPIELLNFTPDRQLAEIKFDSYGTGNVFCGNKMYFTRYKRVDAGVVTPWSYGSGMIHVGIENDPYGPGVTPYHNFVGGGSRDTLVNSGKSVVLDVDYIDTKFDILQVACAEFDQVTEVPRQITIVASVEITGTSMTVIHDGSASYGSLTLNDITLFPATILKAKTLTTNKNYLVMGNVTERKDLDIDVSTANSPTNVSVLYYPFNVHSDLNSCSLGGMMYDGSAPTDFVLNAGTTGTGDITPFSRWEVTRGEATVNTVTYDGNIYLTGEVITGIVGQTTITFAGAGAVRACATRNRYTTNGGDRRENTVPLSIGWTYKDPGMHSHCTGYWDGETYGIGALFYDKKGNPFYVKHITDFTFPGMQNKPQFGITRADAFGAGDVWSLVASGINITSFTIPPDIIDQISGFSIVRNVRNPSIITQGLLLQTVDYGVTPKVYRPASYIPVSADALAVADKVYSFICPDGLVGQELNVQLGANGDILEEACWLMPNAYAASNYVRAFGSQDQVASKMLECLQSDLSTRTATIDYYADANEAETVTGFPAGGSFQNGNMQIGVASPDITCITSGAYTLDNRQATGGKKSVLTVETDFKHYGTAGVAPSANNYSSVAANAQPQKILMNYKKASGATAYGDLEGRLYISTGHYQPINDTVKTETFDGDNYVFNNIEIFGGDCFVNLIDQGYALYDDSFTTTYSYALTFPCQNNCNYDLRQGRKTSNVQMYYTDTGDGPANPESIVFVEPTTLDIRLEEYNYNQGYSSFGNVFLYPAGPSDVFTRGGVDTNQYKFRLRWSAQKTLGEAIDSFRIIGLFNFRDVDGQGGEINNVKTKDGRLFIWQNKLVSYAPILERQLLSGIIGDPTTIGVGGVIDRYDPLNSSFGNQHQWSLIETKFGFCWFDMRNKAFVVMNVGGGVQDMSNILGLNSYFNEVFLEAIGNEVFDENNLLNSPTFNAGSDMPLVGVGITGVEDPRNNMVYMTFKFSARKTIQVSGVDRDGYMRKDFTIGYLHDEVNRMFIGFYDNLPAITHNHNQIVIGVNDPKTTTQFVSNALVGTSWTVGETISIGTGREYICKLDVVIDNVNKLPNGALGSTYWTEINAENELWVLNQPSVLGFGEAPSYQYNMFFGRVVDNELWIVINPRTQNPFYVASIEQKTFDNINYTSIYTQGAIQSAADQNITGTNTNYRFIYDSITSNLPLSTTGRIVDRYLLIKFVKRNWTTLPYVLTGAVKILEWLKSKFTEKR